MQLLKKLREKDKTLTPRKSHLQTAWFGGTYGICLKQCFCLSFLLSQCTSKVVDGFHAVIRSLNAVVSLWLVQVATLCSQGFQKMKGRGTRGRER